MVDGREAQDRRGELFREIEVADVTRRPRQPELTRQRIEIVTRGDDVEPLAQRFGLDVADAARSRRQVAVDVIPADLSLPAEVGRVAAAAGSLDVLVNNAGAIPAGDACRR